MGKKGEYLIEWMGYTPEQFRQDRANKATISSIAIKLGVARSTFKDWLARHSLNAARYGYTTAKKGRSIIDDMGFTPYVYLRLREEGYKDRFFFEKMLEVSPDAFARWKKKHGLKGTPPPEMWIEERVRLNNELRKMNTLKTDKIAKRLKFDSLERYYTWKENAQTNGWEVL